MLKFPQKLAVLVLRYRVGIYSQIVSTPGKAVFLFGVIFTLVFSIYTYTRAPYAPEVYAATSSTLNFQGRLLNSAGGVVPDGYYNIRFKLYDGGTSGGGAGTGQANAGTNLWTESYYDSNGVTAGNDNRVRVVNGYFSVSLGSQTSFPSTINWDQELWLTMDVGGSTQTATPTYDGEMLGPSNARTKLTGVPYAFQAGSALGVSSNNTSTASTDSNNVTIQSGNATGATSNSGNITIDNGTATGTTGTISVGTANASGVTIGRVGVGTLLQGNISVSGGTNNGVYYRNSSGNLVTTAAGNTGDCLVATTGAAPSWGSCSGGASIDLQTAYDNSTNPEIVLDSTRGALTIRDNSVSLGSTTNLFEVQNNAGSTTYFSITPTGTSVNGLLDIAGSLATKQGTDYSTVGSPDNINFGDVSFVRLTGASAQTINGISGGRDGERLTILNVSGSTATIANNAGSSSAANRITTGTGASISLLNGSAIELIYDSTASLWRVQGGVAGGSGSCSSCATTALDNLASVNINTALNATSNNLTLQTTTSGNIILSSASNIIDLRSNLSNSTGNLILDDTVDIGSSVNGIRVATDGSILDINGDLVLNDQVALGSATTGLQITTAGVITDIDGASVQIGENLSVTSGGATITGNTSVSSGTFTSSGGTISLNASSNFATNINTGTSNGAVTIGGGSGSFAVNSTAFDVSTAGAVSGVTTLTGSSTFNTTGGAIQTNSTDRITNAGALTNITGYSQSSGNFLQSGAGTFGTGTGAVSLNGATTVGSTLSVTGITDHTGSIAIKKGADYSTVGTIADAAFGDVSLVRLTGASAQQLDSIAGGRDGEVLVIVNAAAQAATISNETGTTAANRILTGTGGSITLPVNGAVTVVYDSGASRWRVVGDVAGGAGTCAGCANTSLSNLASVAINTALLANADNTIDLGSSAFSFRSLYADTSVLSPSIDVASAGTLAIGNSTATAVSVCNSANCDTLTLASNADADTITVGDSLDTVGINGTTTITGTTNVAGVTSINNNANNATNINTGSSTSLVTIGGGSGTFSLQTTNIDISSAGAITGLTGLTVASGGATITSGGLTVTAGGINVNSTGITNAGSIAGATTINASGLITGTAGATISGAATSINASSNFATNINTGTSNGAVTIGGGSGTFAVDSTAFDVSTAGAVSGVTGYTQSSGAFSFQGNAASTFSTSTGNLTVDATSGTATLGIGSGAQAKTIQIGSTSGAVAQTINIGNNATAASSTTVTIGSTIGGVTTLQSQGGVKVSTIGSSTANSGAICRDSSTSLLTYCDASNTTGKAFLNGGNAFGGTAVLGTTDSNSLQIKTNNTVVADISTTGATTFTNSGNTTAAFAVQNASGVNLFRVDTSNSNLSVGTIANGDIQIGQSVTNIVTNPSFESGTSGWATYWSGALSQSSSGYVGQKSLQVVTVASNGNPDGASWTLPAGLSTGTYVLSMYLKASSGTPSMEFAVEGATASGSTTTAISTSWVRYTSTFVVSSWSGGNSSNTKIRIRESADSASSITYFIDGVQLEANTASNPYASGYTEGTRTTGTATVGNSLEVNGIATFRSQIISAATALFQNSSNSVTAFQIQDSAGTSNLFTADTTNNRIGIGTAAPGARFDVHSSTQGTINSRFIDDTSNQWLGIVPNSSNGAYNSMVQAGDVSLIFADSLIDTATGLTIAPWSATTGGIRIDTNGDVGIGAGATTPTVSLQVGGTGALFQNNSDSSTAFRIQRSSASDVLFTADTAARSGSGGNLIKIGNSTGTDTATTILQLDGSTAVPTSNLSALNGGLFYNSTTGRVNVIEGGTVKVLCNATDAACGSGGGSTTTLQNAYDNDTDTGDTIITLSTADDGLIIRNPSSSGSDSTYNLTLDQLSTGAKGGLSIQSAGTGNLLLITDTTATAADVLTIADGGNTTFKSQTNSTSSFQIQNAAGTSLLSTDTTNLDVTFGGNLLVSKSSQTNQEWSKVSGTAGSVGASGVTTIDSIRSSIVYNGSLYVGTEETGKAGVYKYNNTSGSWTSVGFSDSTGALVSGTTAIDSIYSMAVYNGKLYVGTARSTSTGTAEVYSYDGTTWVQVSGTAGTVGGGATTGIDAVRSLAVYNGSLYAGTYESTKAEVYRYDGGTAGTTWTKVSNATAGTISATGNTAADGADSLVVYNNALYVGTEKSGGSNAEILRYDGGTTWTRVSNAATLISSAGTTNMNIRSMVVHNGSLYAGGQKGSSTEIYRYDGVVGTWTIVSSGTAGTVTTSGTTIIDASRLVTYNGSLYAYTSKTNITEVYRYSGTAGTWTKVSQTTAGTISADAGSTTAIDSVFTATPYDGSLYIGTDEANNAEVYRYSDNLVEARTSTTAAVFNVGAIGTSTFQNSSDSTMAFNIQNASGASLFTVDSTNAGNISLLANVSGETTSWVTNPANLSSALREQSTVTANGYVYILGGANASNVTQTATYYAKINANGSIGSFTATTSLPLARQGHTSVVSNGYIYVIGGRLTDASGTASTVYYAKLAADGTIGAWNTTTSTSAVVDYHSSVAYNGYVYILGGSDGTNLSTDAVNNTYYAKANADGTLGAWTATTALPVDTLSAGTTVANGYIYMLGGRAGTATTTGTSVVYYAPLNTNGTIGTWNTTIKSLPTNRAFTTAAVSNGYIYSIGGRHTGTSQSNVYYAQLNSDGTTGVWQTSAYSLPDLRDAHSTIVSNGYIYALGGENGSTEKDSIYYTSTARVSVGGNLDLLGPAGQNMTDGTGSGSLTAGNTTVVGDFSVSGTSSLQGSLNVDGTATFRNQTDSTSAFAIQNSAGTSLFSVDTTSTTLTVGANIVALSAPSGGSSGSAVNTTHTTAGFNDAWYASIVVPSDGLPIISHQKTSGVFDLMVTKCTDVNCSTAITAPTTVNNSANNTGQYSAMAVGSDGFPVIAYYDATATDLIVTKCGNTSCSSGNTTTTVDSTAGTPGNDHKSVAIGTDTFPVISYWDGTANDLKFVKCGNTSCSTGNTIRTITTGGGANYGQNSSMAIGSDGFPVIAYYDTTNTSLRVYKCSDASCSAGTDSLVDNTGITGQYPNLKIGTDNKPVIAYGQTTPSVLKFIHCADTSCSTADTALTLSNTAGEYNSMVIPADGKPYISTRDTNTNDLVGVKCGTSTCSVDNFKKTLDSSGAPGYYSGVAIASDGYPIMASQDLTAEDVRTYKCPDAKCEGGVATYSGGYNIGSSTNYFNSVYAVQYYGKSTSLNGFDVAEEYAVEDMSLVPGEIVAMNTATNKLKRASSTDRANVFGIVSTQPGLALRDYEANRTDTRLIALVGRVPLKVKGPIVAGDPITISAQDGVGMKATTPGMIVGRAMETTMTDGTIQVFVQTQYYVPQYEQAGLNFCQFQNIDVDHANIATLTVTGDASVGGNLTVAGDVTFSGKLTVEGHIVTGGSLPTVSVSSGAVLGTNTSQPVVVVNGNDTAGTLTVDTTQLSSDILPGDLVEVTYVQPFTKKPKVFIQPNNLDAVSVDIYRESKIDGFVIKLRGNLAPGKTYDFDYFVVE